MNAPGRYIASWIAVAAALGPAPANSQSIQVGTADAPRFEARAAAIVAKMTLEEKASQLKNDSTAVPRLHIPAYNWWSEGLHGVARAGEATVFPQAIGLAATWHPELIQQAANAISTEFRAKYAGSVGLDGSSTLYRGLTVWSPNVNIFRDPRWGRGQETFGEDPYLTSRFGVAFIKGLQGADPTYFKTLAVVKHFAVHSGPEADRHKQNVAPSLYDLEDTYLPAFRAAVTVGQAGGVMCAYNALYGVPACASPLLGSCLRAGWGLKGHIVSDCSGIADFFRPDAHGYTRTPQEAVAVAIKAGTDMFCSEFGENHSSDPAIIVSAVRQGLLPEPLLDQAVRRMVEARLRLGLIDRSPDNPYSAIVASANDTRENAELNARIARESLVLLKNDGLLPLKNTPRSIAVIGPNADSIDALVGNYSGTPSKPVTLLAGLKERFPDASITFVEGTGTIGVPLKEVPEAAFCVDRACTARGLKREEFAGADPAGTPVKTSVDRTAAFAWGRPVRVERNTVIRWSGFVTPAESGPYRFRLESENGYRVLIDGKGVVGAWDAADPSTIADGEISLRAGQPYAITVEARQSGQRGDQRLFWSNFSQREEAAVAAARNSELVVFAAGLNAHVEGEEMRVHAPGFVGGDRSSLNLPEPQQALLEKLHATGKPLVLVLMNGSALGIEWADRNTPAIVEAWYPGGEGGRAVADLIAGDFSPAGRLPVTFYRSVADLPAFEDYTMKNRTYRYFKGRPLYPFGYGKSFTRFRYAKPLTSTRRLVPGRSVIVSTKVTNTGDMDGDEVVQLYITRHEAEGPIRALKGFQRIHLARGESRNVQFLLDSDAMSSVLPDGRRRVLSGKLFIWIGGGQPNMEERRLSAGGLSEISVN